MSVPTIDFYGIKVPKFAEDYKNLPKKGLEQIIENLEKICRASRLRFDQAIAASGSLRRTIAFTFTNFGSSPTKVIEEEERIGKRVQELVRAVWAAKTAL